MTSLPRLKRIAQEYWTALDSCDPSQLTDTLRGFGGDVFDWQGFKPVGTLNGVQDTVDQFWHPLRAGLGDLRRETHFVMAGRSNGRQDGTGDGRYWAAGTGYLHGHQTAPMFGVPMTHHPLRLRWGEFIEFDADHRIIRSQFLIDVVDWLEQIGLSPLPAPRGVPHVYPAPTGLDGCHIPDGDSDATLEYGRQFIFGGLNVFDRENLASMKMADYFHPNVKWYGPGGIGACLSFRDFETLHQAPWLAAFPDRAVQDLDNLIAEGCVFAASSMPGVLATHTGPYLGFAPTHKKLAINGVDFWVVQDGQITENWVFVDMIDLFDQLGHDLLQMARYRAKVA